ncbi:TM0106 family RecB-like putative nuclease [Cnuibacter sp. UC19_7]|uniref:TM0106 family RecB-like putative nuclease n=1 Tax=Cnuibacter sp. UC19_7 TaxID=3350166 RepID=UPI00366E45B5
MIVVREGEAPTTVLYSASDLTAAAKCEFALVRTLDAKLGRIPPLDETADPMLDRAARLGDLHEERTLERYLAEFGRYDGSRPGGVALIERPDERPTAEILLRGQEATLAALRGGADIVYQATFYDGRFLGYADFIRRTSPADASEHVYEVYDTKLARRAKVTALLQLAAYADQLTRLGIAVGPQVHLLLGDGSTSSHDLVDVLPVYLERRSRLESMLDERLADPEPVTWGDPRFAVDGRCDVCAPEVEAHRDLLLVASMRTTQRVRLLEAGIGTIDELAASSGPVPGMSASALDALRDQARMQVGHPDSLVAKVFEPSGLAALPVPDAGDVFFDFEGDPLYTEGAGEEWGLDYLFGVVEHDGAGGTRFLPFWAHDYAEEREALRAFLDYVTRRRAEHPGMHVYHYADYERAHLQNLTARHGVGESQLDDLLRGDVLVDLYPVVKRSIRVSSRSYGLKKLEPLYMGDRLRESDVTTGGDSILAYVRYTELRDAGLTAEAEAQLREIADYNEYDCESTLGLRDWLLARAEEHGVTPAALPAQLAELDDRPSDLTARLRDGVPPKTPDRSADQQALALAAAAVDYHRREAKTFWWEHYARLVQPLEDWADTRDVLIVTRASIDQDWVADTPGKAPRRRLVLRGDQAPGSRFDVGDRGRFLLYEPPHPWLDPRATPTDRAASARNEIVEVRAGDDGVTELVVEEWLRAGDEPFDALPVAMTPSAPPPTASIQGAIGEWGERIAAALPALPRDPALDLLRRRATSSTGSAEVMSELSSDAPTGADAVGTITSALRERDGSFVAVQGPPGAGKTYTGARVIARLALEHGWRIGVVAQSHAVVEHMLESVVSAGVPADRVGKSSAPETASFSDVPRNGYSSFLRDARERARGVVLGGTAWDFTNLGRVSRRELDLVVVDEAGQYSLANTIAVSMAARRILLLGDPQQLPQVTQGTHPEPVDRSALGWLGEGHDVLPPELGFFLAETWRLHPALCAPVSALSYESRLRPRLPETSERALDGIRPGLHLEPVPHRDRSTHSTEEADRVVALVDDLVGRHWTDLPAGRSGPLRDDDVIVVAAYNAQVELIRAGLDEVGRTGVQVGTVDRFQGREAAIAIVSLAASSAADVPRGIGFLLMKNRLNVALSRAKWAAYLVHSPALRDHLPYNAADLAALSSFLLLTGDEVVAPEVLTAGA